MKEVRQERILCSQEILRSMRLSGSDPTVVVPL